MGHFLFYNKDKIRNEGGSDKMKKGMKELYTVLVRRDEEVGICAMDILKYALVAIAMIGAILLLTRFIGFAAAFAVTILSVVAIAAGICFCIEE